MKGDEGVGDIKWIKLSVDLFHNRKIRQIECLPHGDTLVLIWIKLLILAGCINDGGLVYITPEVGYTMDSLASELGRPVEVVRQAMDLFCRYGMTETDEEGIITLCGWEKHQNVEGMERVREQTKKRVQKHRAKKALDCNVTETLRNATEEDIEEEEETEEEKEYHSFTQAREEEWDEECAPDDRRKLMGGALGRNVVFLSDAQMEDLLNRLSLDEFDYYVSLVAENELAGKHYKKKTHYQAILDMVKADRKVKGGKYGN